MSEKRTVNAAGRPQQRSGANRPSGQRPAGQGQRRPNNKRKRRKKSNASFIIILVIVAILAVGAGILVASLMGGNDEPAPSGNTVEQGGTTEQTNTGNTDDMTGVLADNTSAEDEASDYVHAPTLNNNQRVQVDDLHINPDLDSQWLNVLLLGSDQRNSTEPFRTDSMIICSINKSTGEVKLTSLMRDTAMLMGEGDSAGLYRVNVACYVGGPEYLMQFLNEKLNLNIQYYVMVDFTSFSIIADNLGGIDIAVSKSEMEEINYNLHRQARVAYDSGMSEEQVYATHVYLEEYGENVHLNGPQVLAYARIRKLDSDSARTERQRKVLEALLTKLRTRSAQDVMSLAMSLSSYITTNMSIDEIISVALVVVTNDFQVEQHRIPENGTYVLETRDGESMLYDTNWEANAATVYQFIYGK